MGCTPTGIYPTSIKLGLRHISIWNNGLWILGAIGLLLSPTIWSILSTSKYFHLHLPVLGTHGSKEGTLKNLQVCFEWGRKYCQVRVQSNQSRFSCLTKHSSVSRNATQSRNSTLSRNRTDTLVCPITNCLLQVVFFLLPAANYQLFIAYCLLPITNCKLPMT